MNYFESGGDLIKLVPSGTTKTNQGLRRSQLGAIHALASYFSLPQTEPALVVMPTGSGKTAVILLTPFVLRTGRTLIVTPSQLVRRQIVENAESLAVLRKLGLVDPLLNNPSVVEVTEKRSSEAKWKELITADFVVSTPQCISPGVDGVVPPPADIFDLILMDEAHHSEAPSWASILQHFPLAKKALFTATPFRRDKKEVSGRLVFNYPLRLAYEDGVFGKVTFVAVEPTNGQSHDLAIATKAAELYRADRDAGLDHRIVVRTDSKQKADELGRIYADSTDLNLMVIHSKHSLRHIRTVLGDLKAGTLDGVICVAMLGEGFDLPQLKIAAVHAPHRSLAVTLQFIGRFARTSAMSLGDAKFVAVPNDIRSETNELYRESAAWLEIVSNISAARVEREVRNKETAATFSPTKPLLDSLFDVVMTDFTPYFHVKIYRVSNSPNLRVPPAFSDDTEVLRHEYSDKENASITLVRQMTRPRWTDLDQFSKVEHDLIIVHYDVERGFLFVNSSRRSLRFYRDVEEYYGEGTATILTSSRISRVLSGLKNIEAFSIGLKNSVQNSNSESYQIRSGPSAQRSVSKTDGILYQRGHLFLTAEDSNGSEITLGYSSSSKVWSNYSARIGELLEWCRLLAKRLESEANVVTGTQIDNLQVGDEVFELPEYVVGVCWSEEVYREFPQAVIRSQSGVFHTSLLDVDIQIDRAAQSRDAWTITISHPQMEASRCLSYSIPSKGRFNYKWADSHSDQILVIHGSDEVPLLDYLHHYPFAFFLHDFGRLEGACIFSNHCEARTFPPEQIVALRWKDEGIDIRREFTKAGLNFSKPVSIQDYLCKHLMDSGTPILMFDHGTGEMADFVSITETSSTSAIVRLYHCKGSGGPKPGDRVDDAYEVCGQVTKCLIWLKKREHLRQRMLYRLEQTAGSSQLLRGTRDGLLRVLADKSPFHLEFEIIVVQPGLSASGISEKIAHVLAAASDYVRRASDSGFTLLCSP